MFIISNYLLVGHDFYLPYNLGTLGIRKVKKKAFITADGKVSLNHIPIDYQATKRLWAKDPEAMKAKKVIRQLNEHTNGFKYYFYWDRCTSSITHQSMYKFRAARTLQRTLSKVLRNEDRKVDFCLNN